MHHALHVALPLLFRHCRVNRACKGVTFGTLVSEDLVPLLLFCRITGDVDRGRPLVLRQGDVAGLRCDDEWSGDEGDGDKPRGVMHLRSPYHMNRKSSLKSLSVVPRSPTGSASCSWL